MKGTDNIHSLLERYYSGTTTQAEEQTLRRYFAADNVDPQLEADREMFRALDDIAVPATLEKRLDETIRQLSGERRRRRLSLKRWYVRLSTVAASVAVIIALALPSEHAADEDILCGMSPDEVAAQATRALEIMSRTINAGSESATRATAIAVEIVNNQNENI